MIKQTVTYTNFEGEEVVENLYFNISEAEYIEMEADPVISIGKLYTKAVNEKDPNTFIAFVKKLLLVSYLEKLPNGKPIKNKEIRDAFASSEAYSTLFMELIQDKDKLDKFITGVVPKALTQYVDRLSDEQKKVIIEKARREDTITQEDVAGIMGDNNKNANS